MCLAPEERADASKGIRMFAGLRIRLLKVYAQHSFVIDAAVRGLLTAAICAFIREACPFQPLLCAIPVLVLISLIAAFLPTQAVPLIGCGLITGQAFGLDLLAGAVALLICLVLYLLFLRFVPGDSVAAVLTPFAMFFGFDPLTAICCGLRRSPSCIFAVCPGAVLYAFVEMLGREAQTITAMDPKDYVGKLHLLVTGTFTNELAVTVLGLAGCLVFVCALRKLSADYAPYIAALMGGAVYLLFLLLGRFVLHTELNLPLALIGTGASVAAAELLLLVLLPLDYRKSEYLQFEDDDYYYYVKAVPKAVLKKGRKQNPGESASFHQVS